MRPKPMRPRVFPRNSVPEKPDFSHFPACVEALACGTERASPSMRAKVCSATLTELPPGVFITRMPRCVAASMFTLSTPTPARPITRSCLACSSKAGVTFVALRTTSPSALAISFGRSAAAGVRTSQPVSRSRAIPRSLILSATIIFMGSKVIGAEHPCQLRMRAKLPVIFSCNERINLPLWDTSNGFKAI